MQAFYRRVKPGKTPRVPRFRPRHAFSTLCYPARFLLAKRAGNARQIEHNCIVLPTSGKSKNKGFSHIPAELTEPPPEKFKEVAVARDSRGNYYCSFVSQANAQIDTFTHV